MKRKVLYSPGHSTAGWVSWAKGPKELRALMLTHEPLVRAVEAGERLIEEDESGDCKPVHPALIGMIDEIRERWGEDFVPFIDGVESLQVMEVEGEVRIREYDGHETVVTREMESEEWL